MCSCLCSWLYREYGDVHGDCATVEPRSRRRIVDPTFPLKIPYNPLGVRSGLWPLWFQLCCFLLPYLTLPRLPTRRAGQVPARTQHAWPQGRPPRGTEIAHRQIRRRWAMLIERRVGAQRSRHWDCAVRSLARRMHGRGRCGPGYRCCRFQAAVVPINRIAARSGRGRCEEADAIAVAVDKTPSSTLSSNPRRSQVVSMAVFICRCEEGWVAGCRMAWYVPAVSRCWHCCQPRRRSVRQIWIVSQILSHPRLFLPWRVFDAAGSVWRRCH